MAVNDFHKAFEQYPDVVRAIQHKTGLPDDAFGVADDGRLVVGDISHQEAQQVRKVARGMGLRATKSGAVPRVFVERPNEYGEFGQL